MINEPKAAALAYVLEFKENQKECAFNWIKKNNILLLLIFEGGHLIGIYCDIKFTDGDTYLGGENFDLVLMEEWINKDNLKGNKIKLPHNIRLKRVCEKAKIELSSQSLAYIILEDYLNGERLEKNYKRKIWRRQQESIFQI